MELALPLNYEQVLFLISQMPENLLKKLKLDIDKKLTKSIADTDLIENEYLIAPTENGSPTMLFGAWADTDYDPKTYRRQIWRNEKCYLLDAIQKTSE